MIGLINKILDLLRFIFKTRRLGLEINIIRLIRLTYCRIFLLKRYDSKNRIANIMGFSIKFCNYSDLLYLFNEIFINQEYYFLTENKTPYIIDCGSNIGMSIIFFKMLYPNSSILSFEPSEKAFSCLEHNIKHNNIDSVVLYKKALSNKEGIADFYYDQEKAGSIIESLKQERMSKKKCSVETIKLSNYIDQKVDFLKMDIEGAELDVIEELKNKGKLSYIKQMVIEYHHHIVKQQDEISKILQILENEGFGYQIESSMRRPFKSNEFQDVLIYAYNKAVHI